MDIFGSYTFNAPPDRVWDLLMDPAAISSCIPGCDRFEPDGEDRYNVTLTVGARGDHRNLQRHGQSHRQDPPHVVPSR